MRLELRPLAVPRLYAVVDGRRTLGVVHLSRRRWWLSSALPGVPLHGFDTRRQAVLRLARAGRLDTSRYTPLASGLWG